MIKILGPDQIEPHLSIASLMPSAERAFKALSDGSAHAPAYVLNPTAFSDIHVKSATLSGCDIFTIKMAGWSQALVDKGVAPSSGMIAVFDSRTCQPIAILRDDHLISDYRTAAAGAVVHQLLAPKEARSALIVGTGTQARLQLLALLLVRHIDIVQVWGRSLAKSQLLCEQVATQYPCCSFEPTENLQTAVQSADIIVAATGAKEPLIQAEWVRPGQHITSVGSDDASKCEIAPEVLANAAVFVEAASAGVAFGNPSRAIQSGLLAEADLIELGSALDAGVQLKRDQVTVASLAGLGVQDLLAVNQIWRDLPI